MRGKSVSVSRARTLRRQATRAEQIIWQRLRARQMNGRKWRRQQPVGPYIVDFICPELKLVVEVDGDVHAGREAHDAARQAALESTGLKVIRFTNNDVIENLDGVLTVLWSLCGGEPE